MKKRTSKRWILASERKTFTPKRVDKKIRAIEDPEKFAKFITKRDRKLLDRLEAYDRQARV